jgi:hypothetical protein
MPLHNQPVLVGLREVGIVLVDATAHEQCKGEQGIV